MSLRTKATVRDGITINNLAGPSRYIEYQPGNGTRYQLVMTWTGEFSQEANDALGFGQQSGWVISFPWGPYETVLLSDCGNFIAPDWFADKLKTRSIADAMVLAELIGTLTNRPFTEAAEKFTS